MSNSIKIGGILKAIAALCILGIFITVSSALAQSPDSLMISNDSAPPGGTATVSIFLRNTQFSVSGFTLRFVVADSNVAVVQEIERGDDVVDFEHFDTNFSDGTCRIIGLANLPGGGNPPPLPIGMHELARVHLAVSDDAPWGFMDSLIFAEDMLPPENDNSISDSTGYILEVPTTVDGWIMTDIFQDAGDDPGILPSTISLSQNFPNPFNIETRISFNLPSYANYASLRIYDLVGREVRKFDWSGLNSGEHSIVWNGADELGRTVSTGVYFYRLEVDSETAKTMKMTLLK